jgi:hypothetical protein
MRKAWRQAPHQQKTECEKKKQKELSCQKSVARKLVMGALAPLLSTAACTGTHPLAVARNM